MVTEGHDLYREIYSDQAPLHTELLAALMKGFGSTVATGRALALAAGVATLVLAAAIAATLAGPLAGALCAGILLSCAPFLKFSTAVLITTPATCLGLGALLCALVGGPSRRPGWWVAAGGLLGLALMTKLATVYFVPIVAAAGWWGRPAGEPPARATGGPWAGATSSWLSARCWPARAGPGLVPARPAARHGLGGRRSPHRHGPPGLVARTGHAAVLWRGRTGGGVEPAPGSRIAGRGWCWSWLVVVACGFERRPLRPHHLPYLLLPMAVALSVATSQPCARLLDRPGAPAGGAALLALASGAVVVTRPATMATGVAGTTTRPKRRSARSRTPCRSSSPLTSSSSNRPSSRSWRDGGRRRGWS